MTLNVHLPDLADCLGLSYKIQSKQSVAPLFKFSNRMRENEKGEVPYGLQ